MPTVHLAFGDDAGDVGHVGDDGVSHEDRTNRTDKPMGQIGETRPDSATIGASRNS